MFIEFLSPEVFDAIIIINIIVGLIIAGRRFRKDLSGPIPDDAAEWARAAYPSAQADASRKDA